jgi:ADP-heptose:LPS heptosyltransferase
MEIDVVKFLVVRLSSIGDIVLTSPIVRCLKQQVENAEVHFLVKKQFVDVVKHNPYIDKIIEYDSNIANSLKYELYDYVIDLHNNFRTLRLKNKLKIIDFSFKKLNIEKWLMVNFKINKLPEVHIVDRYFETLKVFDVTNDGKGLDFFIPQETENSVLKKLEEDAQKNYIAIVVGANYFTKQIPPQKISEIIKLSHKKIILLGGQTDSEKAVLIENSLEKEDQQKVKNYCGKLTLLESAAVIKFADLVITPDTGLMHIAAAYKKKIISFWGNTIPQFGMYPYQPEESSIMLETKGLKCRPCSKIGFSKCPYKHFKCMNEINVKASISSYLKE